MTLEQSLWADMVDLFNHGTKKQWQAAERHYKRFMRAKQSR